MARLARASYLVLVAWQVIWHYALPSPLGSRLGWLALLATVPLLLPLRGVLQVKLRALTWAGYLSLLYFVVAVMEAWSNEAQRWPALLQVLVCCLFLAGCLGFSRQHSRAAPD